LNLRKNQTLSLSSFKCKIAGILKTKEMKIPFTNLHIGLGRVSGNEYSGKSVEFSDLFKNSDSAGKTYKISVHTLFSVFRQNSDIRNCVREIQNNTGKSGTSFVDVLDSKTEIPEKLNMELFSLFNYSGSTHTSLRQLLKRTVRDMEVAGNAYWVVLRNGSGCALGFQPVDPRTIASVADKSGKVLKYVHRVGVETPKMYEPEDIIHFKGDDDPLHEVFGLGKLEPIIWEARTDSAAMVSNYKFFENNAVPSALYILDEKIPADKLKEKFAEIKKHFGGAVNYKKAGAIVGVKDIKMLNMSQKDMDFLAGRKFSTEKICAAFGVPKFILGYTETVNNNNGVELEKNFMEKTIIPLEQTIEAAINAQFMSQIGTVAIVFNEHVFSNAKDVEARAEKMYRAGMKTLRQVKRMIGDEITPEDKKEENFDKYIIQNGASAVLLEDVGLDPVIDQNEE